MAFSTEIMTDVEVKDLAIHDNNFDVFNLGEFP